MKKIFMMWLLCVGLASVCLMVGCEAPWDSDDDSDSLAGTSTIQGNVSSFDAVGSATVAGASYRKAGITVKVKGTDKSAETAADGTFVISGLAAGTYTLVFKLGDVEVEYPIGAVAENARVEITNVFVGDNGVVRVEKVVVVDLGTGSSRKTVDNEEETAQSSGGGTISVNVQRGN